MGSEMMFLGQKQQREKMMKSNNFTQTCNRFSQFLKERRSLGHLDAFKSFASSELENKGNKDVSNNAISSFAKKTMEKERTSLELFPLNNSQTAAVDAENSTKNTSDFRELPKSKEESENTTSNSPSMTIFYGGRVLVFDELPEDKAQEIMSLVASHGTIMSPHSQAQTQTQTQTQTLGNINVGPAHPLTQDMVSQGASNLSDMPIARRVSLHRFMEKRKHRLAASAPYQLSNVTMAKEVDSHQPKINDMMMRSLYEQQQLELKL